ncbi:MAG TPA: hypothetical protein VJM15_09005 [Sphingomicrobium sp.]|nr:hypothetical protein [Sphingomicrobium sp.]
MTRRQRSLRAFAAALVAALLVTTTAPARASWYEAKSHHFLIYADAGADEIREYAKRLERFDQAVRIARGMGDPALTDAGRLKIYVLRDPDELSRIVGGDGTLGVYVGRASGSYAFVARKKGKGDWDINSDIIFYHEYAHHLMLQNWSAALPTWFVEGFAEFLSTAKLNDDGSVTLGAPLNHRAIGVFASHRDLTLAEMVAGYDRNLTGWQQELVYAHGWLLTHYLTFEPSRKGQLDRYIAGIQKGETALESARAAFGDILKLEDELGRYVKRKQLSGVVIRPETAKLGEVSVRPLSAAEAAVIPARIRSDYGVDPRYSGRVAAQARKLAAPFPADLFAQATLAKAEYDAGNYAAAQTAADRALAANPRYGPALIYKGRALMALAKANPAAADWDAIRGWFVKANQVDTENAEPLMLFYQSFVAAGVRPTDSAVKGLNYALILAPQDNELRLMAIRQLLLDGKAADARRALAPMAFNPHASAVRNNARKIGAAIDGDNAAGAVKLIDDWLKEMKK